jgi:hypothetical protein
MPIEIPELGDDHHQLWGDLIELDRTFPGKWTIIGAHMVALYAWEAGMRNRPSQDVDVLVNVRVAADATEEISRFLRERKYEPEISARGVAHLFKRSETRQIDVFAPDGIGSRANTRTVAPNRTIRIPGGTQALNRSVRIDVTSRGVEGQLPRPNLLGAILVKVRGIEVDDVPSAQRSDVARLLSLVQDPDELAAELTRTERRWLARHQYFADPRDAHWDGFETDDREQAALVFRRLLNN